MHDDYNIMVMAREETVQQTMMQDAEWKAELEKLCYAE